MHYLLGIISTAIIAPRKALYYWVCEYNHFVVVQYMTRFGSLPIVALCIAVHDYYMALCQGHLLHEIMGHMIHQCASFAALHCAAVVVMVVVAEVKRTICYQWYLLSCFIIVKYYRSEIS